VGPLYEVLSVNSIFQSASVTWKTNAKTVADYVADGMADGVPKGESSPFLSFINSATCYVNLTTLFNNDGSSASFFQSQVTSQLDSSASSLVPSNDPGVIAGYKAIYTATANKFLNSPLGHIELLLYASGVPGAKAQTISVQVAFQHPFSHGRLYISTNDPFDSPVLDPQYFSHSAGASTFHLPKFP
jgi:choline dehydrogenase